MDGATRTEVLIGFGLFFLSELLGMSKYRDHSVLMAVLHAVQRAFPYEVRRRPPTARQMAQHVHEQPVTPLEPIYTPDELEDMPISDLRAMASSLGHGALAGAKEAGRNELVRFLTGISK